MLVKGATNAELLGALRKQFGLGVPDVEPKYLVWQKRQREHPVGIPWWPDSWQRRMAAEALRSVHRESVPRRGRR